MGFGELNAGIDTGAPFDRVPMKALIQHRKSPVTHFSAYFTFHKKSHFISGAVPLLLPMNTPAYLGLCGVGRTPEQAPTGRSAHRAGALSKLRCLGCADSTSAESAQKAEWHKQPAASLRLLAGRAAATFAIRPRRS